jgi:hypothetical protein
MLANLGKRFKDQNPYQGDADDAGENDQRDGESAGTYAEDRRRYELTISNVNSAASKLATVATDRHDANYVRYAVSASMTGVASRWNCTPRPSIRLNCLPDISSTRSRTINLFSVP